MQTENTSGLKRQFVALWATVIVESVMLIAMYGYNIYEIRRNSELVQNKINGLAEFSSQQGAKIDRMTTALELYVQQELDGKEPREAGAESKVELARTLLEKFRQSDQSHPAEE